MRNPWQIDKKSLQIWSGKIKVRKSLKKGTWKGLELFLGGVWGGFWESFGGFGGLAGRFLASFFHACTWDGLQKRSWRGQGWILLRFWGVWRGFREGFGQVLRAILKYSG